LELMFIECLEILRVPLGLKRLSKKYELPFPISEYYQYKQSLSWFVKSIAIDKSLLEESVVKEIKYIISFNQLSNSLKQKKLFELNLYKNRFFRVK
jgi:hypothetical protein